MGVGIQTRSYTEFNDKTLIQRKEIDSKLFNGYVDPQSQDPDESWRSTLVRPLTRNKIISIAAHLTSRLLFPSIFAQNEEDEEDEQASQVMRDIMDWIVRHTKYEMTFLFSVIQALSSPATILEVDFVERLITVRKQLEDGTIVTKEAVDEVLSGFQTALVPVEELLIANIYEYNLQKQRFLIRRRYIDYSEAQKYKDHPDFKYVKPGVRVFYSHEDRTFYQQYDTENPTLLEEVTYLNRGDDREIVFLNGILVSSPNQTIKHRRIAFSTDGELITIPVYRFAKSGYEPIDEQRFFYYKSAAFKLAPEQDMVDRMYRLMMDGAVLTVIPPVGVYGSTQVGSNVVFPGAVNAFQNKDARIEAMLPKPDLSGLFNATSLLEKSIAESTQDTFQEGIQTGTARTAHEIDLLQQNALVNLGLFGKMIGSLVVDMGLLMTDIILTHMTVGEVEEIIGGIPRMKYRSFVLNNADHQGSKVTKKIEFVDSELKDTLSASFQVLEKEGGLESKKRLIQVNPQLFRRLKWLLTFNADELKPRNDNFEKAIKLEAYDRLIMNPLVDQEAVTRDFLVKPLAGSESEKYLKKQGDIMSLMSQQNPQNQPPPQLPGVPPSNAGPMAGPMAMRRGLQSGMKQPMQI